MQAKAEVVVMKKGFTVSEILITLGIIGLIAAITIPSIHAITPDKDKGRVLNAYNALLAANNEIFNNPSLYNTHECTQAGEILTCNGTPLDPNYSSNSPAVNGDYKYPFLVTRHLSLASDLNASGTTYTFTTADNINWTMTAYYNGKNIDFYKILLDMGYSETDRQCTYSAGCSNPGQYSFIVDAYGKVHANDKLTEAYLLNPDKLNDRAGDLKKASEL